jgi:hypothetical protein
MKRKDRLASVYIQKTPLQCIYIAGSIERRPVKVATDRLTIEPREGNKFIYWRRYWVPSARAAAAVLDRFVASSWREQRNDYAQWYWLNVDDAEARLRLAASDLGVNLTANADVLRRVADVVSRYDEKLTTMIKSGEMKPLNKGYKAYRIANERLARKAMPYEEWLDKQLEPVLEAIIAEFFRGGSQAVEEPQKTAGPPLLLDGEATTLRR